MAVELETRKDSLTRLREYIAEVRAEMKRVTWPSKQEIYGTTVMVILTTFLFAFYFGLCDWLFGHGIQKILNHFLGRGT
jgi:preprotein translocase subunit SecE